MRGLGDTCTPTNCPNGPYSDSNSNYSYWLVQGQQSGVIQNSPGTDPAINTAAVSAASNQSWASYSDLQNYFGWELCVGPDVAAQDACSQRNTQRAQQISNLQQQYHDAVPCSAIGGCNGAVVSPPIVDLGPVTSSPASPAGSGTLSFTTSRGGTTLYPGDTWTIRISGAKPNAAISVVGGVNGAMNTTPTGTTDANGNFSLSGTIDSSQVGSWYEGWTVGGSGIGSISFTVVATPQTSTPQTSTPQTSTPVGGGLSLDYVDSLFQRYAGRLPNATELATWEGHSGSTDAQIEAYFASVFGPPSGPEVYFQTTQSSGGTTTAATTDNWFTDQMISGVPNWALVAAAAAVAFLVLRGKK
jgi:hypothetical protein